MKNLSKQKKLISCVVPIFNEENLISEFIAALDKTLQELSYPYEILLIDDGSQDNTCTIIQNIRKQYTLRYVRFSRNFGKEKALSAGLEMAKGDAVILIDSDFQHPLELIKEFIIQWENGYDMVYAVRTSRSNESWLKRNCAKLFYQFASKINRINIPANAGDYRLLDRKIVNALLTLPERNRFMKGLYGWVGFKEIAIPFEVQPRKGGTSQWNFYSLLDLAITGITSFTAFPLRMIALGGICISSIALLYAAWIVCSTLLFGVQTPGWATIVTAISFFGGVQLFAIGVVGEYIGRVFDEVKNRPLYIVDEVASFDDSKS
ncbi:glycosyltransferase family 2 protein [Legionella waltersii]|uniref:Glycosyltransferase, group 2 family protein (Glycan biosynthesis) n=1 Tax=Legionella waltersii TaxID=66969 RepID=A0A0W1A054_9GAMM|nr:glycosyltransferase family 2 protein [Legionella waltersii]KTD74708.1 glycosyltransferase, group 2 family protein (glycan biosynthesis) [Legionella waltersii]SNU99969.1 glycosyltransferase, group 2 family protein (glycan biosynthesis) [Legionella waltersii]